MADKFQKCFGSQKAKYLVEMDEDTKYGYFKSFLVQRVALKSAIDKAHCQSLKRQIDLSNVLNHFEDGSYDPSIDFYDLFEAELNRITDTISSHQRMQELSAKSLLRSAEAMLDLNASKEAISILIHELENISSTVFQLQHFANRNADIFLEIAEYGDKMLGTNSNVLLSRRLHTMPWKKGSNNEAILTINNICGLIQMAEIQNEENKLGQWNASNSLNRSTPEYWEHQLNKEECSQETASETSSNVSDDSYSESLGDYSINLGKDGQLWKVALF